MNYCPKHDVVYSEKCWCCAQEKLSLTPAAQENAAQSALDAAEKALEAATYEAKATQERVQQQLDAKVSELRAALAQAIHDAETHRETMPYSRADLQQIIETASSKQAEKTE